jgi:hydroxyethylthiazole kinase
MINELRNSVKAAQPLIHCITNPISINQCANAVLAVGARPMMAEHPDEAPLVTRSAGALLINLGNLTEARMQAMKLSVQTAGEAGVPYVLDVCGAACLPNRRSLAMTLADIAVPAVIKGNYSEIYAMFDGGYSSSGVDADKSLDVKAAEKAAAEFALRYGTTVLASGRTDVVTDGHRMIRINNGTQRLASITGTGCMLGALCAAFLSAGSGMAAAETACVVLGVSGQLADNAKGSGSFSVELLDSLSTLTDDVICKYKNTEGTDIG